MTKDELNGMSFKLTEREPNRLSFRAFFEDATFYDDNGNEYTKSFYLYDVAIYENLDCGISKEDMEDQLKEQGFSEREIQRIEDDEFDGCCWEGIWFFCCPSAIEQCTGLKDKNGTPIYEGDIIQTPSQRFFLKVDDFNVLACVYPDFSDSFDWSRFVADIYHEGRQRFIEVVGNIHEHKEQKR